jgi:hypothetical protein
MVFSILPRSVPFLYSGTEFGCAAPTNLEFGSRPDAGDWPTDDELLLFSPRPLDVADSALRIS